MSFYNKHGLLNAHEAEEVSENCPLFTLEQIVLRKLANQDSSELEIDLIKYIELLRNFSTHRFNNIPNVLTGKDAYISHDQYTTICAFSHAHGMGYHKEFWNEVKWGTYDNLTGKFNIHRMLHPRDYLYIGYLNDNFWCKLLMPVLCAITIHSFLATYKYRPTFWERLKSGFKLERNKIVKTDGQLLTFVRNYGLRGKSKLFSWTFKLCDKIARGKFEGGFKGIFATYFQSEGHPNRELSSRINNYNLD